MKLAFLGIGQMGHGMAARLLQAGLNVCVYNRTIEKCAPLQALGARVAATPAEAVAEADIVFTMLSDDLALLESMGEDTVSHMRPDAIHVSMSTISAALAADMAKNHARMGRHYLACPVFGRPDAAAAGLLRLCLSGDEAAKARVGSYLAPMGEIWDFGDSPFAANVIKLAGNFMILSMVELLGEAFSLVENNGIDPAKFAAFISSTMFAAPVVKTYSQLILNPDFDNPGFMARLAAKDIGLVQDVAKRSHTAMPVADLVEGRFLQAVKQGWGEKDMTVITKFLREEMAKPSA